MRVGRLSNVTLAVLSRLLYRLSALPLPTCLLNPLCRLHTQVRLVQLHREMWWSER